jgi:hypothetical protein
VRSVDYRELTVLLRPFRMAVSFREEEAWLTIPVVSQNEFGIASR